MDMLKQAYVEVMTAGDAKGTGVHTTIHHEDNITKDFDWDNPEIRTDF